MDILSHVRKTVVSCFVVLAIQGCGGGENAAVNTAGLPGVEKSGITIALTPAAHNAAKEVSLQTLPSPTNIRFLVSNSTTGFSAVQDVTVPMTTSLTIPVPVAIGYTLEVLSYAKMTGTNSANGYNNLLKYNIVDDIAVAANANTSVNITLQPIAVSITPPSTVEAGGALHVSVDIPSPLHQFNYLQVSTTPFTNTTFYAYFWPSPATPYSGSGTYNINAPTSTTAGDLYFQGVYFINPKFIASTDTTSVYQWLFIYPNANNGDSQMSTPLTIPTGGITLGVNY